MAGLRQLRQRDSYVHEGVRRDAAELHILRAIGTSTVTSTTSGTVFRCSSRFGALLPREPFPLILPFPILSRTQTPHQEKDRSARVSVFTRVYESANERPERVRVRLLASNGEDFANITTSREEDYSPTKIGGRDLLKTATVDRRVAPVVSEGKKSAVCGTREGHPVGERLDDA